MINYTEKGTLVNFLEILFISPFTTSSERFTEYDTRNVVSFQIEVSGKNIKETTLAKHFIKVTVSLSFTRLRITRQINTVHEISK